MAQILALQRKIYTPQNGDTIPWDGEPNDVFRIIDNEQPLTTLTIELPPVPGEGQLFFVSVREAIQQVIFRNNEYFMRSMVSNLRAGGVVGWIFDGVANAWYAYLPVDMRPYALNVLGWSHNPINGQELFFGNLPRAPITVGGLSKIYIQRPSILRAAEINCFSSAQGSNEPWSLYVRVNNTDDYLIGTQAISARERPFSTTNLNIILKDRDFLEVKVVPPVWTTPPASTMYAGYLYVE